MKNQRLLNTLEQIDDKYIEEAAPQIKSSSEKPAVAVWIKWASLVACAVIAVCVGIFAVPSSDDAGGFDTEQTPNITDNLPLLASHFESDGMGFEGLMLYDISENGNGSPWTENTDLVTLPVYRNLAYTDLSGTPLYLSDENMLQLAENTATALGKIWNLSDITLESTEYNRYNTEKGTSGTDAITDGAYSLSASTYFGRIQIEGNGLISVFLSEPISLPKEYCFTSNIAHEEAITVLEYLTEYFSDLKSITFPLYDTSRDYSFAGDPHRYYRVYEGSGSLEDQILNYYFDCMSFLPNEEGKLWIIRFGNLLESTEKIGDYPLITADIAQNLLLAGQYITSVPEEYLNAGEVNEENIVKVELVYRTGNNNELFMPYYRFYIELTEFDSDMTEGLTNYGAYYVPAVNGQYLSDFPVWDGSFN
uniref:hypothetical protein n=1 Tax=Acetatifactor sp. TaxID=1872090 RepID=UPI00405600A8